MVSRRLRLPSSYLLFDLIGHEAAPLRVLPLVTHTTLQGKEVSEPPAIEGKIVTLGDRIVDSSLVQRELLGMTPLLLPKQPDRLVRIGHGEEVGLEHQRVAV